MPSINDLMQSAAAKRVEIDHLTKQKADYDRRSAECQLRIANLQTSLNRTPHIFGHPIHVVAEVNGEAVDLSKALTLVTNGSGTNLMIQSDRALDLIDCHREYEYRRRRLGVL